MEKRREIGEEKRKRIRKGKSIPLNSPVHGGVSGNERRNDVEHLGLAATEGVEDGRMEGTGQRALTVGRQGVGRDALGGRAAWSRSVYFQVHLSNASTLQPRYLNEPMPHKSEIQLQLTNCVGFGVGCSK